jgi:hypothetical protein
VVAGQCCGLLCWKNIDLQEQANVFWTERREIGARGGEDQKSPCLWRQNPLVRHKSLLFVGSLMIPEWFWLGFPYREVLSCDVSTWCL